MNYKSFKKKNKKFIWCSVLVAAVFVLALSVFFVSKAMKENKGYRTISVVETSGNVTVVKNGIDYSAYPGMHLQEGHVLVTGGDSTVRLVLDGDKYVKVESGSRVVFETLGFLGSKKTKMNLERGAITAELVNPLEDGQEFIVNTPNAVLAVRGTFFRVSLEMSELGEIRANIMTYGGQIASRRIFPTGEVEEAEVLVGSGYMTAIHMDDADTVYLLDGMRDAVDITGDNQVDIAPIRIEDISDDDLVDIYYSAENGHELFITAQEAKADIEDRNIDIENEVSIYQKAAEVVPEGTATGASEDIGAGLRIVIDDGEPLLAEAETDHSEGEENDSAEPEEPEEPKTEPEEDAEEPGDSAYEPADEPEEPEGPVTSEEAEENPEELDTSEEPVSEQEAEPVLPDNAPEASDNAPEASDNELEIPENEPLEPEVPEGDSEVTEHTHTEKEIRIEATCTSKGSITVCCKECGEIISKTELPATGHTIVTEQNPATCEAAGWKKEVCSVCGTQISWTELPMTGHTSEYVGSETIHSRCAHCGITLSTAHEFTEEVTREATCTEDGMGAYSCECGYSYESPIAATGHTPEGGGEEDIHSICGTCSTVLEDGSYHNLVEIGRFEATCTAEGQINKECACGYAESETIPLAAHQYDEGFKECTTCGLTMVALNSTNFPDAKFLTYVSQFDTDNDGYLYSTELEQVTSINIAGGWAEDDGGYTNLQGISYFTQLTFLNCSYNAGITSLDLRALTEISSLTVTGCTGLTSLVLYDAKMMQLDLNGLSGLQYLDIQMCGKLAYLYANNCTSLISVEAYGCTSLEFANFIDATNLQTVNMGGNRQMSQIHLDNCVSLTSVDVTDCGANVGHFDIYVIGVDFDTNILTGYNNSKMSIITE